MITESYAERSGDEVLFRLAIDGAAVLDVLTDDATLAACREMLRTASAPGMHEMRMGTFGPFGATMVLHGDRSTVSIFVNGPGLDNRFRGNQAAGVYVRREELLNVLDRLVPEAA